MSRGIALLFLGLSALDRGRGPAPRPGRLYPQGRPWYPLYRRLGRPQGRSGRPKISSHRDSIPDRPARSQALYRLSYPAHEIYSILTYNRRDSCSLLYAKVGCCLFYPRCTGFTSDVYLVALFRFPRYTDFGFGQLLDYIAA